MQGFSVLAGYMSTFRNGNLEKISLVSTFEKPYFTKMWPMSTFENENSKIIFFVSSFLDWYKAIAKNLDFVHNLDLQKSRFRDILPHRKV